MPLLILRRDADGCERIIAPGNGADTVGHSITHVADDGAEVFVAVQKPGFCLLVPLFDLLLRHAVLLGLCEHAVVSVLTFAVLLVEIVKELVVLLHELLHILEQLILILSDPDLRRCCRFLLKGIGDAADGKLVLLQIIVFASVNLDLAVDAGHGICGSGRVCLRGAGVIIHIAQLKVCEQLRRRILHISRTAFNGEFDFVLRPCLGVDDGKGIRYGVIGCAEAARRVLPGGVLIARIIDAGRKVVQREVLIENLFGRKLNRRRIGSVGDLEPKRDIRVCHARRLRAARISNVLKHHALCGRCRRVGTLHMGARCRHQIGVLRRLRDHNIVCHEPRACVRDRCYSVRIRARRRHRLRRCAQLIV